MCMLQATFPTVRVIQLENIFCNLSFTSIEVINNISSALEAQQGGLKSLAPEEPDHSITFNFLRASQGGVLLLPVVCVEPRSLKLAK